MPSLKGIYSSSGGAVPHATYFTFIKNNKNSFVGPTTWIPRLWTLHVYFHTSVVLFELFLSIHGGTVFLSATQLIFSHLCWQILYYNLWCLGFVKSFIFFSPVFLFGTFLVLVEVFLLAEPLVFPFVVPYKTMFLRNFHVLLSL